MLEADIDKVKAVSQVAAFFRVAQKKGLPVTAGHAAYRGDQRGGPDVVTVENAVAGGFQVAAVEPVGQLGLAGRGLSAELYRHP